MPDKPSFGKPRACEDNPVFMKSLVAFFLLWASLWPAWAELPRRDLVVALRQIEEGGAGYTVGTQPESALLAPQQVQVRNGVKASLRLTQAMPVQWVQAASRRGGGEVKQAVTWFEAGQSLVVLPRWPGGQQPVTLEVEVQSASVQEQAGGAALPVQARSQLVTTVSAPLGQWVTVASTGAGPQPGVYGTQMAGQARRLLQLRVLAP
jgi:hypothetical protein